MTLDELERAIRSQIVRGYHPKNAETLADLGLVLRAKKIFAKWEAELEAYITTSINGEIAKET